MPSSNCGLYSFCTIPYSRRTWSQIETFSVPHYLHDSLNVCTETIGFKIIRKVVDEHELITALRFLMNEKCECRDLEDELALLPLSFKQFLPTAWVHLKSEYTDFGMKFLKRKKKSCSAYPITVINASMKNFMCF